MLDDLPPVEITPLPRDPHPELYRSTTHGMVDFNEDVSSKDIFAARDEGYDSVELVKRYTTVTMGPNQGKLETVNAVAVLGEARGETIDQVGTTVWRPPYAPITLGALGGRAWDAVRYLADATLARGKWCQCPLWPANGSGPITTATPTLKCSTFAPRSESSTSRLSASSI